MFKQFKIKYINIIIQENKMYLKSSNTVYCYKVVYYASVLRHNN